MTIRAIYEKGVFTPVVPVDLPERTAVDITIPAPPAVADEKQRQIFEILRQNYPSGESDVAERHNEHQP